MPGIYKFETKSLKMLWERVQFSKVWSLQPATLLLAYSFIRHELLYGVVQVFYVLFRNKDLRNIIWWLVPLYVSCEILNVEKTTEKVQSYRVQTWFVYKKFKKSFYWFSRGGSSPSDWVRQVSYFVQILGEKKS